MKSPAKKIILFDGICNLCNSTIIFVIKRDRKNIFQFAALQSEPGQILMKKHRLNPGQMDSIVLIEGDKHWKKSAAALRIARELSGIWPALYIFMIIPRFFRDFIYDSIANNRYRWFGKKDQCMIPTPELEEKFL